MFRNALVIAYLSAGLIAMAAAGVMSWIGLTHNPQGEFYGSELGTNWFGIAYLWMSWFAVFFGILAGAVWFTVRLFVKERSAAK